MKLLLVYVTILICFYSGNFNVECNVFQKFREMMFGPAQALEESPVLLAVETSNPKLCYLTHSQFVTNKMSPTFSEFLFACPAESEDELKQNEDLSKTKNALFIKRVYENPNANMSKIYMESINNRKNETIERKCEHPVVPSIINIGKLKSGNPDINLYLVGYEIFLGQERIKSYSIDKYESAGLKDDEFAWFNLYTVAFNHKTQDVVSVFSHTLSGYILNYKLPEDSVSKKKLQTDYSLGKATFYGEDSNISEVYEEVLQTRVFNELSEQIPKKKNYEFVDWPQNRYLEGVHLAPLEAFGIPLFRLAGQTFGNMAPMWNLIYRFTWSNVETHVKYLVRGLNGINVITGTYGTLTLSGVEIYLQPDQKVKVPAAFWKIISYSRKAGENYSIIVVTNNNPYENTENLICSESHCQDFGWDNIEQDFPPYGLTSCCELTEEILAELKIDHCVRVDKTLNLNEVPHWNDDRLTLNVKEYIEDQIKDDGTDKEIYDYRNNKEIMLNEDADEEVTFSQFMSVMYTNYVLPLLSAIPSIPFISKTNSGGFENPGANNDENVEMTKNSSSVNE